MKQFILDNLKWVITGVCTLVVFTSASVWKVHHYVQAEAMHEKWQDDELLAGKQSRLLNKVSYIRKDIIYFTREYGCDASWVKDVPCPDPPGDHKCKGTTWEEFQKMVWDYKKSQEDLKKMN